MTSPNDVNRYDVRETARFGAEWQDAVRLGYINSMVDPATLIQFREWLTQNPYITPRLSNVPANLRQIALNPRVRLWYTIIEDDRVVWLESVRIVEDN